jgi:hypothetical protein
MQPLISIIFQREVTYSLIFFLFQRVRFQLTAPQHPGETTTVQEGWGALAWMAPPCYATSNLVSMLFYFSSISLTVIRISLTALMLVENLKGMLCSFTNSNSVVPYGASLGWVLTNKRLAILST